MTTNRAGAYLDSSVIVRYLANDPPEMADRATEIIEKQTGLIVTEHILAESAFVLQSVYGIPRPDLVDALMEFVRHENIQLAHIEKPIVLQALGLCRDSKRVSFADALLWAEAFSSPGRSVYTFDQRFPTTGISIIESD